MISFMNDYSEGAHPRVLELLVKSNLEQNAGYGEDVHSKRAKEAIKKQLKREDVDIHFIPGGTQANLLAISSFLRPHQCVIAAHTGHINVHETGAIEATGHKVLAMPSKNGKLTTSAIKEALEQHTDEHMVQPRMVYISNTTELGTIYTLEELTLIHEFCRKEGLILYLDGARLASALTCSSNDVTFEDIARLTDVFTVGGTKNGALLGEALVICREDLKQDFRYLIKQRGAMMAKGFVLGIQFEALFMEAGAESVEEGSGHEVLYLELGRHANGMAEKIADVLKKCGYDFFAPACSNQLFPLLPNQILASLSKEFVFSVQAKVDGEHSAIRLVTSWATTEEQVEELIRFFRGAMK